MFQKSIDVTSYAHYLRFIFQVVPNHLLSMSALYFLSSVFLLMIFFISSLNVEDNIIGMVLQQQWL